jgi:hypothetical protein
MSNFVRIIIALCLTAGCNAALAQPAIDTAGATQCSTRGYNTDRDPKGTNVRAGPRANAAVIGHLPAHGLIDGSDADVGAEFQIFGSKDGWLLIEYKPNARAKALRGWMSGRLVSGTTGSATLRAAPSDDGEVVATLSGQSSGGSYGPDSFAVLQVHGCQGKFSDVTVRLPRSVNPPPGKDKPLRGWVGRVCSNQLTTCDPG